MNKIGSAGAQRHSCAHAANRWQSRFQLLSWLASIWLLATPGLAQIATVTCGGDNLCFCLVSGNDYSCRSQGCTQQNTHCKRSVHQQNGMTDIGCNCERITTMAGDPHMKAWDRTVFDFQGVGEYVLAESEALTVQVRLERYSRRASFIAAVGIRMGKDTVSLYASAAPTVRIGGQLVSLECNQTRLQSLSIAPESANCATSVALSESRLVRSGDDYRLSSASGQLAVELRAYHGTLDVTVEQLCAAGETAPLIGLAGTSDGTLTDGLRLRDGSLLSYPPSFQDMYQRFGESWRISNEESLFDYADGESTDTFTNRAFPEAPLSIDDLPAKTRESAAAVCRSHGVVDPVWLDACTLDVGLSGDEELAGHFAQTEPALRQITWANSDSQTESAGGQLRAAGGCSVPARPPSPALHVFIAAGATSCAFGARRRAARGRRSSARRL